MTFAETSNQTTNTRYKEKEKDEMDDDEISVTGGMTDKKSIQH